MSDADKDLVSIEDDAGEVSEEVTPLEDTAELPAELLEEAAEEVVEEVLVEGLDENEEPVSEVLEVEPEPEEEVAPIEPDPPEDLGPQDVEGIITKLSPKALAKLQEIWKGKGSPRQFDYQAARWSVYDNGDKFVRTGGQPGMDQFYGSLSIG